MLILYQLIYILLSPFIFILLIIRKDTRKRFLHFLGLFKEEKLKEKEQKESIWIHAVSFGEAKIGWEFIKQGIHNNQIHSPIVFTSTIENVII